MNIVLSINSLPIRLTEERLAHIERRHPEMKGEGDRILETVAIPDRVQEGDGGTLLAIRHYSRTPLTEKYCVVVYREVSDDGFVITAYLTNQPNEGRRTIWKR